MALVVMSAMVLMFVTIADDSRLCVSLEERRVGGCCCLIWDETLSITYEMLLGLSD